MNDIGGSCYRLIEVRPLSSAVGAEVSGVDLVDCDGPTFIEIHRAFLNHHVLFFRDQELSLESHKAFGRRFGSLNVHPQYVPLDGHPEILPIVKEADAEHNIGGVWHSDITFLERPALGSILYAIDVPATGGDTLFANQELAFEELSTGLRQLLLGLRAVHSDHTLSDRVEAENRNMTRSTKLSEEAMRQPVVENLHPVIRTHPETGRKSLFVNRAFTVRFENMTVAESKPLLEFLYEQATKPEFTCRFHWENCSVAMWDNRCVQHYALNDYHGQRRYMHRVTVNGDRPT
ncbi:MAG: TauD/TfdA family dioxygenase [Pseudomonadota bacterium]|nr:TauD/TfdA family dioxygenase [Gammaproteobacteria bacterium]MEE3282513.1 TauD/TfdA family dioxygenase [Pseudomonadota bacterium]MEE3293471.1 TauD/TfdA family dioxygenase [Pseudomonadota bacterium]